MKHTLRITVLLLAGVVFAPFSNAAPVTNKADDKQTVRIGVILPLSGNNGNLGEPCMRVIDLFKTECTEGHFSHNYKLFIEDDQLTPRLSAQAANKLINIDHVDALLTFSSATGNVVAPMAEQKHIPHICIGSDTTIASKHPYSFLHWIHPREEMRDYFRMARALGVRRLGIIAVRQQGVIAVVDEAKRQAPEAGVKITSVVYFNPGERDFRLQLLKMSQENPDAIMPGAFSPELEIILRQMREMKIDLPTPTVEVYDFVSGPSAELAEGQYYVSAAAATPEFNAKLHSIPGHEASVYAVPQYYNMLAMTRAAFESSPSADRETAYRFLSALKDFPTPIGPVSTDSGRFIHSPTGFFQIKNGHTVAVSLSDIHPASHAK